MREALDVYQGALGFVLDRGDPTNVNNSLTRGDARIMLEVPADLYSAEYNDAIKRRLGTPSALALYIEAPDLDELYQSLLSSDLSIADPLAERPWGQLEFTVEDHAGNWLTFWKATTKK